MRFQRISLSLASLLAFLAALPAVAQSDRRTFQADFDRTWAATLAVVDQVRLPVTTAEKSMGLIRSRSQFVPENSNKWVGRYTTQTVRALSGWLDVQLDLTFVVVRRGDTSAEVKIETGIAVYNAWTEIWRSLPSSGNLEKETFDAIQSRLDSMPAATASPEGGGGGADGTVSLSSRPDKSEVEVDGAFIGQTPVKLTLPPGKHTIRVTRKGYGEWTRTLQVMPGAATTLDVELSKP